MKILKDYPLAEFSTFRIGGTASEIYFPENENQLCEIINKFNIEKIKYYIFGNASNLLFPDAKLETPVIFTTDMKGIIINGVDIECQAGVSLSTFCKTALDNSLMGAEFLYGIPGSVGGALCMNAGAYGGEIGSLVKSVKCVDVHGNIIVLNNEQAEFSYRNSYMKKNKLAILSAVIGLSRGSVDDIKGKMDSHMKARIEKQPLNYPSAGSVFKRPEGFFAGALIEQCGLKGKTVGGAQVSEKHAGFIINLGGASAADVKELIGIIKNTVFEKFGVILECEVIIVE